MIAAPERTPIARRSLPIPVLAIVAMLLAWTAGPATAQQERILSFEAGIIVEPDGSLSVEETIEVVAAGREIRRGIFRDIPLRSITPLGFNHIASFDIVRVERDGAAEPYFLSDLNAGVRIYIGEEQTFLEPGRHRYTIAYRTDRQLFHREGEDELYWNVTGNGWAFPIDRAVATVHLPGGEEATEIVGYTGGRGETGEDFEVLDRRGPTVRIATTRTLQPGEGLTVAVVWPQGAVDRPSMIELTMSVLDDNCGPLLGLVLLAVLIAYFVRVWDRLGRDPEKGTIIPLFGPPDGLSPVAVGFIWNRGFGGGFAPGQAFTVALTSLATRGAITIEDMGDRTFAIGKSDAVPDDLPRGERAVFDDLFGQRHPDVTFGKKYEPRIASARTALRGAFGREYSRLYHLKNRRPWFLGALIGLAGVLVTLLADVKGEDNLGGMLMMLVFAGAFAVPSSVLISRAITQMRTSVRSGKKAGFVASLAILGMSVGFLVPVAGSMTLLTDIVTPVALIVAVVTVAVTVAFWFWLAAPTHLGRLTLDAIEGYRLYLSVAEADRLNQAGREPEITAALFEKHLPYAMALGVEREWTEKFEAKLAASAHDPSQARSSYQPQWYHSRGSDWTGPGALTSSLTRGLGGAASSAATRLSSGSGGSSGGSSGGGGGGGGGGW